MDNLLSGLLDFRSPFKSQTHFSTTFYVTFLGTCFVMMSEAVSWVKDATDHDVHYYYFRRMGIYLNFLTDLFSAVPPRIQVSCLLQVCGVQ